MLSGGIAIQLKLCYLNWTACILYVYEIWIAQHSRNLICKETIWKLIFPDTETLVYLFHCIRQDRMIFYVEWLPVLWLENSEKECSQLQAILSHWSPAVETVNEKINKLYLDLFRSHFISKSEMETQYSFSPLFLSIFSDLFSNTVISINSQTWIKIYKSL